MLTLVHLYRISISAIPMTSCQVWDAFKSDGYSIRLVHPQQWSEPLFELCSYLQEYFGSTVGCSSYLTPSGTQGFGPHYDDAEIFVVQLEGRKRWRLYNRPDAATSPRTMRVTQFTAEEIGEPNADFWYANISLSLSLFLAPRPHANDNAFIYIYIYMLTRANYQLLMTLGLQA